MAKAKGPLFSVSASGKIKHRLTYSHKKVGNIVRLQRKNKDAQTDDQLLERGKFQDAVAAWNGLSSEQKAAWNLLAGGTSRSGYNLFLKYQISGLMTYLHFDTLSVITNVTPNFILSCYLDDTAYTDLGDIGFLVQTQRDSDGVWQNPSASFESDDRELRIRYPAKIKVSGGWRLRTTLEGLDVPYQMGTPTSGAFS